MVKKEKKVAGEKGITKHEYFTVKDDGVPEHVKNYGKHKTIYKSTGNGLRAWF